MQNGTLNSRYFASAGLAALLTLAPAAGAAGDDTPAGKKIASAQPPTEAVKTITSEELDRKLGVQKEQIKSLIDDASMKNNAVSEAEIKTHEEIKTALNGLSAQHSLDWVDIILTIFNFGASVAAFAAMWQARKYKVEQEAVVKEQKEELKKLNNSAHQIKSATQQGQIANYLTKQNLEHQTAMIQVNRTLRALEGDRNINRTERVGPFPEMYHYITERIQNAKKMIVITMPFYQFGVIGSPHGLCDFHHMLHEMFGHAARGDDDRRLMLITYDDDSRYAMARKRYSRAIHAMDTLDETPQSNKLEDIYSKYVWGELKNDLRSFQKILDAHEENRKTLMALAEEQRKWFDNRDQSTVEADIAGFVRDYEQKHRREISGKEAMDLMFIERLAARGAERDKNLFSALNNARDAFCLAVEDQEKIYFGSNEWDGTGTPWPQGATVVTVKRGELEKIDSTFDNDMTVCIDGVEVIHAHSSLIPFDTSRKNRLMSMMGKEILGEHKGYLARIFKIAGRENIPEEVMLKLNEALPDIEPIKEWLTAPDPKV